MNSNLPPDLEELFRQAEELTGHDLEGLRLAGLETERDSEYQSSFVKGDFVNAILSAMHSQGVSQTELASRWGKSKQYLSRILDEENGVNFTVETMVDLALNLDRRIRVEVLPFDAPAQQFHTISQMGSRRLRSGYDQFGFAQPVIGAASVVELLRPQKPELA